MGIGIAATAVIGAVTLRCLAGAPPDIARVPIPGSTLTLVVTKEPSKRLHYGQLLDHDVPVSEQVMLTGYMREDLSVRDVESHGDEVGIHLSGGDYSIVVRVDLRRGVILSPTQGRATTAPPEQ